MGHWTPTGIESMDYDDDDIILHLFHNAILTVILTLIHSILEYRV